MADGKGGAELPLPVLRRQVPRWARGWVGDPRARSRTPPASAPFAKKEKSGFQDQDVKPLCSKPKGVTNRRVNEVLKRSPRVTGSWVLQLEVADRVSFGRLKLSRLRQKLPSRCTPDVKKRP
jgi:hypothetical protein